MPVAERKERLRALPSGTGSLLQYSDHQIGRGRAFYDHACALKVEGIVSKRVDAPYAPDNRGLWSSFTNRKLSASPRARASGGATVCIPSATAILYANR